MEKDIISRLKLYVEQIENIYRNHIEQPDVIREENS